MNLVNGYINIKTRPSQSRRNVITESFENQCFLERTSSVDESNKLQTVWFQGRPYESTWQR